MPTIDYGSVILSVDEDCVEAFFPFEHGELRGILKRFKGIFNGDRKSWVVTPRYVNKSVEDVVSAIEEFLWEAGPEKWPDVVEHYAGLACTTRNYEIKFGVAGLRLRLPEGHPGHWTLDKLSGASRQNKRAVVWSIPARSVVPQTVIPLVKRAWEEDRGILVKALGPYSGRTARGTIPITPEEADRLGLFVGEIVFAEYSFVKLADPTIVNMPVHVWPYLVSAREDKPGEGYEHLDTGVALTLEYPDVKQAYSAVRKRMVQQVDERSPALDAPHVLGKWHARNKR